MAELEEHIARWRREQAEALGGSAAVLEELEGHLRDAVHRSLLRGRPVGEAFEDAVARLGSPPALAAEFARVTPKTWLPVRVAVVALIALAGWLVGLLFTSGRLDKPLGLLLSTHVITVTLGSATSLMIGVLATCYVLARPFGEPDSRRDEGLIRATRSLTLAALGLTCVGIVLGAFWARASWGRFWDWDPREVGGALVLLWDALMLVVLTRRPLGPHATLILGLAGNVVVALAWVGPNLIGRNLHAYNYPPLVIPLAAFVIAQAAFACLGLVPAGCMSRKRAAGGLG